MPAAKRSVVVSLTLGIFLLIAACAGCSLDRWPRVEKEVEQFKLLDEWQKILAHEQISGEETTFSQLIIEWNAEGVLTQFNLEFFVPTSRWLMRYNAWTGEWSNDRRLRIDQVPVFSEPEREMPSAVAVLSILDEYGLTWLAAGVEGDISLWVAPVYYEAEDFSTFPGEVYLLQDGEKEPLTEKISLEMAAKISISSMVRSEGQEPAQPGLSLIYIVDLSSQVSEN
jgi:hypothetical protein